MSYLDSRIAAPASHPQGRTIVARPHNISSAESRPPWRGLNPGPTELKDVALLTVPRGLVESTVSLENVYISYLCNSALVLVLLTLSYMCLLNRQEVMCYTIN